TRLKKGPTRGTIIVLGLVLLGLGLFFLWRGFTAASRQTASGRWVQVDSVLFPEQLEALLENKDLKDTVPGDVLRYREARRRLHGGLRGLGNPETHKAARGDLEAGIAQYLDLLKKAAPSPLLEQEALWAVAKGSEALGAPEEINRAKSY